MLIKTNVNSKNKRMLNPQPKSIHSKEKEQNKRTNQLIQLNYLM